LEGKKIGDDDDEKSEGKKIGRPEKPTGPTES
jgi:hypothetical protein